VASGDEKKQRGKTRESGRLRSPREPAQRHRESGDESREDFVIRGSVVQTPEGYKIRF
jgi:hypothetical protein